MLINKVEFSKLEKELAETGKSLPDYLASDVGKIYVVAITRDECSACKRQKPKLKALAKTIVEKHDKKAVFIQIHVRQPLGSQEESLRSKDVIGHYFYPTNLILLRTVDRGAIEFYRSASPKMNELKNNIEVALEIASTIEKDKT